MRSSYDTTGRPKTDPSRTASTEFTSSGVRSVGFRTGFRAEGGRNHIVAAGQRREMQIVFQDPYGSLSPRMSVAEIVAEGMNIHMPHMGSGEVDDVVASVLEEVGLDPATRHRYPHEFSGGQRQRIAIARAMVLEPKFVMLDEPTSALDMSVQAQVVELLLRLQEERNLAYLFISHDLKVVRALANDVIVMRLGKVVEQGPSKQIFDDPQTDYTKALMAAAFDLETAPAGVVNQ